MSFIRHERFSFSTWLRFQVLIVTESVSVCKGGEIDTRKWLNISHRTFSLATKKGISGCHGMAAIFVWAMVERKVKTWSFPTRIWILLQYSPSRSAASRCLGDGEYLCIQVCYRFKYKWQIKTSMARSQFLIAVTNLTLNLLILPSVTSVIVSPHWILVNV